MEIYLEGWHDFTIDAFSVDPAGNLLGRIRDKWFLIGTAE